MNGSASGCTKVALAYTELKEFDLAKKHRDIALEIEGKT
jgi:hypothetical protein